MFVITIAVSGYVAINSTKLNPNGSPQLSSQPTATVIKGDISSTIIGRGKITPKRKLMLFSTLDGKIEEILVEEGQEVEKGTCLVKIELKPEQKFRLLDLKRRTLANNYEKQELQKQLEFQRKLQEEGLAAEMQMESLDDKVKWRETEKETLDSELELLTEEMGIELTSENLLKYQISQVDNGCIYSPINGTIVEIVKHVNEIVSSMGGNNMGPIMTIADLSTYYVDYKVNELDLAKIKKNQEVQISFDAFPGKDFKGEIENITAIAFLNIQPGSFMDPSKETSQYKTKIRVIETSPEIRPDLSCKVSIKTLTQTNVLLAPLVSVFTTDEGTDYVFVNDLNGIEQREVKIGIADFQMVEILSGVSDGENVYLNPYEILENNEIIKAQQSKTIMDKILR